MTLNSDDTLCVNPADLVNFVRNGVRASFMDADGKTALLAEIDEVAAA